MKLKDRVPMARHMKKGLPVQYTMMLYWDTGDVRAIKNIITSPSK